VDQQTGIQIDPRRGQPIYKQIYEELSSRIRRGAYPVGYRLPTTRQLARELSTHRNTVSRAFEELEACGLVYARVGRGTFVAEQPRIALSGRTSEAPELPWAALLSQTVSAEPLGRLDRLLHAVQRQDVINLTTMYPSADLLPVRQLRRCVDHVLRRYGVDALGFAPRYGLPRLRELIAGMLREARIPVTADEVLITTGSQQALDLVARALVNPGDTMLVDEYTYTGALTAFAAAGARLVGVPADAEGPDMEALRRLARPSVKGFYLMPNGGNPTGLTVSVQRRKELIAWSRESGTPLIEDDYGADLELDDCPQPVPLRGLDPEVLYVGTFSKRLTPALRVGFLVCPAGLRRRLGALKHSMDLGTSLLMQHVVAEFIERGYMKSHLRRVVAAYRQRRDALEAGLGEHLPAQATWERPRRGGFLWLVLPDRFDSEELFEEAQRQGVLISPATLHSAGQPLQCALRLTFCGEQPARLREGARRLAAAIAVLRARHSLAAAPSLEGV